MSMVDIAQPDGEEAPKSKRSVRKRADEINQFRCKNLIAVIENAKTSPPQARR